MDSLQHIKRDLLSLVEQFQPNKKQDISVFHLQVKGQYELLNWLKAQKIYPQFYLNFREQNKKLASIGCILSFLDANDAQTFIQNHDVSLVGGIKFNGDTRFLLPRILLEQRDDFLSVQFIINHKKNWSIEKREIVALLENLTAISPMEKIHQKIKLIGQKANQQEWINWVNTALQSIQNGQFTKVVLANETYFATNNTINAKDFLAESEKYNKDCYHFLYAENESSTFLGSSPERLYLRHNQNLITEAVAGTAMVTEDLEQNKQQAEWLLNDPKNIHENKLVAQDIEQSLTPYIEKISIEPRKIKQLRQVQHLKRKITATLKPEYTDNICLKVIHPTAAIAGYPKDLAEDFIQKTENFDRDWYAGTLGVMSANYSEFTVTIRSAFIEPNNIRVFAGAGIVAGSVPLLEWQEIERKALGLISLLEEAK